MPTRKYRPKPVGTKDKVVRTTRHTICYGDNTAVAAKRARDRRRARG